MYQFKDEILHFIKGLLNLNLRKKWNVRVEYIKRVKLQLCNIFNSQKSQIFSFSVWPIKSKQSV